MGVKITREPGTVWPTEYDWQEQFASVLNETTEPFVSVDAGKLRGLALSYIECLETVQELAQERGELMKSVGVLIAENQKLQAQIAPPRQLQIGDRVRVTKNGGFHRGAEGVIQFIEPSGEKVWVLRDHSTTPVWYAPIELELIEEEEHG